jgi:hypothetical protein
MSAKFKNGITIDGGNIDTASGQVYKINGTTVLSSTQVLGKGFSTTAGDITTIDATQTLTNKTLTSPTLTTPTIGVATATSINKVTITAPATGSTLTIAEGSTLATSGANSLTLTTTGTTNVTLPSGTNTLSTLEANTYTGTQTMPSLSVSAQAANLSMNSNKVTSVTNPTAAQDAATKNYVDKNESVRLTSSSFSSITSATLTAINLNNLYSQTTTGNSGLNVQTATAIPTNGASIANGFIQVKQSCYITISGQITWPSASTTGLRWTHIRHYSATGNANYIINFYDGVTSPSTGIAETPLLGSSSYSSNVSFTTYATANDFFNLWGYHTQGTGLTPLAANMSLVILSYI